jgi:hypothetical protein
MQIRHEPPYKQLEVKRRNLTSFLRRNHYGHHFMLTEMIKRGNQGIIV